MSLRLLFCVPILLWLGAEDGLHGRIPNEGILLGAAAGLLLCGGTGEAAALPGAFLTGRMLAPLTLLERAGEAVLSGLFLLPFYRTGGIGAGDVKGLMMLVIWFGPAETARIACGALTGALTAAALRRKKRIPLMPFLAAAGILRAAAAG